MAKDPAFLFYPGDWLGGTMGMTLEEKGAYLELLVMQWNCGRITDDSAKRIVGEILWNKILHKFEVDSDGFFNKRLEVEKIKRRKHSENQSNNAKKRWSDGNAMAMPLENENENKIVLKEIGSEKVNEAANLAWKDQRWKENLCMAIGVSPEQLKRWMAMFNASICNDFIPNFNNSTYKKMIRGWISKQQSKGVVIEMGVVTKTSDSAPLTVLKAN